MNVAYWNCRVALAVFVLHVGFALTGAWAESKHEHVGLGSGLSDHIGPLRPGSRVHETDTAPQQWPPPVHDEKQRLFTLVDVLEYRPGSGGDRGRGD